MAEASRFTRKPRVQVVPGAEFAELVASPGGLTSADLDEMAVPTYTHRNPFATWIFWRRHQAILELAYLQQTERVLDFGTGTGALLPSLCSVAGEVWATDLRDEIARRLVARRELNVRFCDPNRLAEQLPDNQFGAIVAADVLEHIEEPQLSEYLRLFARKLGPAGRLVVSLPTENALYKLGRILAGYAGKGDYHRTGIRELLAATTGAGYRLQRRMSLPLPGWGCLFYVACFERK